MTHGLIPPPVVEPSVNQHQNPPKSSLKKTFHDFRTKPIPLPVWIWNLIVIAIYINLVILMLYGGFVVLALLIAFIFRLF